MDGFSYTNIFETKGVEYLVIIAFLVMIIPFWLAINRHSGISEQIKNAIGIFSSNILRIPQGLFYNRNHTWSHLSRSGIASIGLDDFLLRVTGEVRFNNFKKPGDLISKGDLLTELDKEGKLLKIYSPLSGEIVDANVVLQKSSGVVNEDPYGEGWIYKVKPSKWIKETDGCYLAEEAISWSNKEMERFKDFVAESVARYSPGTSNVILQDGGELYNQPLSELPDEVWQEFQKSFLS